MAFLMGIDIGTSGATVVVFNEKGIVIQSSKIEYPLYQPQNNWAEQEPADWWKAVYTSIQYVISKGNIDAADIKGIGLSGQMHGAVLLNKENQVLRRAIIWCDQRSSKECGQITDLLGKERLIEITANPALTGFTASKVMWVKNHEPEVFEKINKILLPKDFIRLKLTGEMATEVSDASGMQFMNIPERKWSNEVLSKLGIDRSFLADLYESQEVSGKISKEAAQATGLKAGTPVVGGAGDQAAGAIGNGIIKPGVVSSTIGTSGVVFAYSDKVMIDPQGRVHTFCHAIPEKYHVMGVTQSAGLSLKWFRDNFCIEEKRTAELMKIDPYDLMNQEAEKVPVGSNSLLFLPYLMGERTPHLDPFARGVFFGLSAKHEKQDMLRAIMEGVTYSLKDCLEIILGMGIPIEEIRASGGGSRSNLWRQMQADIFNTEIKAVNTSEGSALGVAILAGVGAGVYKNVAEGCAAAISIQKIEKPDRNTNNIYMKYYSIYKKLYPALKGLYMDLSKF